MNIFNEYTGEIISIFYGGKKLNPELSFETQSHM